MEQQSFPPVPDPVVAAGAATALVLVYSAPTPGTGSRYADGGVAHEARALSAAPVRDALAGAARRGVGETVLEAALASRTLAGYADVRGIAHLAPLARAALLGETLERVIRGLGHEDIPPFIRALEVAGEAGESGGARLRGKTVRLADTLRMALGAGKEATLRDAMRFAAGRDALAREYARGFEISRELARPALLTALSRAPSVRAAIVQTFLEVLAEVPDLEIARRAGRREADDVSRMANGVLKAGGVRSRRGLEAIANLDGILRGDPRLAPTATEPPVIAAAFLTALEYGPESLVHQLRPATPNNRGR